jgi:Secretion system C-terminal sorting domain
MSKHNNANVEQWTQIWSNSAFDGLDMAADLTIDSNGDIILVGTTQLSLTNYDAVVVKYSSAGALLWSQTFNGTISGPDGFVTVLASGTDIYCGGSTLNNVLQQHDALAVNYNGSGTQQWSHIYNSANNLRDGHNRVAMSGSNVVFYGGVQTLASPITWTMVRVELNASTGAQINANLSNNVSSSFSEITDIDIDAQDNIYIAGHVNTPQGKDLKVVKLVSMAVSWSFVYNGVANLDDEAHSIDVSGSFVYVAGSTTSAANGKDLYAVKIPLAGPPVTWQKIIDHAQGDDVFTALNIDPSGQLYLAGSAHKVNNLDLCIYKLDYTNGNVMASNTYNNDYNGDDYATGVAIDEAGNVFVAGQMEVAPQSFKYNLVKWAQKTVYLPVVSYSSSGGYVANVSQLRNANGSANENVLFYNQQNRVATYLDDAKLMYQLVQGADTTNADTTYRIDMRFTKGSTSQKIYALQSRKEYTNYYLGHMLRKGERTPSYKSLWKNNVYTNTDILYTNSDNGCKQYLIARSGAPTGDFEMTFDGHTSLSLSATGNLIISSTIGDIEYAKPKAYSMNLTTGALTLHSWQPSYFISNNKVSFSGIGSWGGALVLEVGEPAVSSSSMVLQNVDWSTMFGAQGGEVFRGVIANDANDVFTVGNQDSTYPIANVGEQIGESTWFGDAMLIKFSAECEAEYISYYGGSQGFDEFIELDLLASTNELHVVGITSSPDLDLINSIEMEDNSYGGVNDGIYAKFDINGFLQFHTYVGGDGYDELVDIKVTHTTTPYEETIIYYIGNTESDEGWPEFQNNAGNESMNYSGGKDGFYIKRMGVNEEQEHMTFFGSAEQDVFLALDLFKGTPVILGRTNAQEYSTVGGQLPSDGMFPKAHNGFTGWNFIDNNNTANGNFFITHFGNPNPNTTQFIDVFKWCSYIAPSPTMPNIIGHTSKYIADIVISQHNNIPPASAAVYVTGLTPVPVNPSDIEFQFMTLGWHQGSPGGGSNDAFLMQWRLENTTSIQTRGTLFGGDGTDIGRALSLDQENNLFLCGTSTINNIAATQEWCDTPTTGSFPMCDQNGLLYTESEIANSAQRAYIAAFRPDGSMLWSTQYGMGDENTVMDICASGNKVWIVGSSDKDWTFEEYDQDSTADYYRVLQEEQTPNINEATIARFDIPYTVQTEEMTLQKNDVLFVFPNPSDGIFSIVMPLVENPTNAQLSVYNAFGQLIKRLPITNNRMITIDLSDFSRGVYYLQLAGLTINYSASLIKQ